MQPVRTIASGFSWLLTRLARLWQPAWKWLCTPRVDIRSGGEADAGTVPLSVRQPVSPEKAPETTRNVSFSADLAQLEQAQSLSHPFWIHPVHGDLQTPSIPSASSTLPVVYPPSSSRATKKVVRSGKAKRSTSSGSTKSHRKRSTRKG